MKFVCLLALLVAGTSSAQTTNTFDSSGNGLLSGNYFFREVLWEVGDNTGNLGAALVLTGTINFDGKGAYSMTCASYLDSSGSSGCPSSAIPGAYRVSASGFGYATNPLSQNGDVWYGLVSKGVFIAGTTENGDFNDLLVAVQVGSSAATNSTVNGSYWVASMDFPSAAATAARDALYKLDADGAGNIGGISASGFIGKGATAVTQNINAARYSFSNGVGTLSLGGTLSATNLLAGSKQFFTSADGSLIFGGSTTGFDFFVGVRASADAKDTIDGLYYQGGVTEDESNSPNVLDSYYGAFNANAGTGTVVGHQRIFDVFFGSYDSTYGDKLTKNDDGSFSDTNGFRYRAGSGGALRVGIGAAPVLGLNFAVQAPSFSGAGTYINPTAIVNAASFTPFTVGISPGELITIFGTGLASSTLVDGTFPPSLGGVTVLINNRPARIYVVSPTQLSVVVPFATTESIASIQVINNGDVSNVVTLFVGATTPGAFTNPPGGVGYAAALHPDFTRVTPQNPAKIGETIAIFMTGLGPVTPAVADGTPAPSDTLSKTTQSIFAFIDGQQGTTVFAGLAPGLIGLYQMNVTIPAGVKSGDVVLEISDGDGIGSEALLPMASTTAAEPGVNAAQPVNNAEPATNRAAAVRPARPRRK